jgi:hypothetical protein
MPFGKHKGQLLSQIPSDYLFWVLYEADAASPWLKAAVRDELATRDGRFRSPPPPQGGAVLDVKGKLQTWYREMARTFHPDRTLDDGAAMKAINHGYERLQELLGIA